MVGYTFTTFFWLCKSWFAEVAAGLAVIHREGG
jgi:hypothetical protein